MKPLQVAPILLLLACAPAGAPASSSSSSSEDEATQALSGAAAPSAPKYEELEQLFADHGDAESTSAWDALRRTLRDNFNDVCGDTFCEGDYSNLEPLRLRCSVEIASHQLKSCKYVFAGSYEVVIPSTGRIKVSTKTFSCAITVSGVPVTDFLATLTAPAINSQDRPLQRPLPGGVRSLYDSLVSCL